MVTTLCSNCGTETENATHRVSQGGVAAQWKYPCSQCGNTGLFLVLTQDLQKAAYCAALAATETVEKCLSEDGRGEAGLLRPPTMAMAAMMIIETIDACTSLSFNDVIAMIDTIRGTKDAKPDNKATHGKALN